MNNSARAVGLIMPVLVVAPTTTALLWSQGPLLALLAAPFASSAVVAGLALLASRDTTED